MKGSIRNVKYIRVPVIVTVIVQMDNEAEVFRARTSLQDSSFTRLAQKKHAV